MRINPAPGSLLDLMDKAVEKSLKNADLARGPDSLDLAVTAYEVVRDYFERKLLAANEEDGPKLLEVCTLLSAEDPRDTTLSGV